MLHPHHQPINATAVRIIVQITCPSESRNDLYFLDTQKVRGMNTRGEFNSVRLADELDKLENRDSVIMFRDDQFMQDLEKLFKHERVRFELPAEVHKILFFEYD